MSATIRLNGIIAHLDDDGIWTSEIEGVALLLNGEMLTWAWERPRLYDLEQDKTDALHMIEKYGHGVDCELIEYTTPSTEGHSPDAVY